MYERIIECILLYLVEGFMEIGLIMLACAFVIGTLVVGFKSKELQCFFTDDTLVTPWEKAERKAKKKAEREARKEQKAWHEWR